MKKALIVLVALMLVLVVAACGENGDGTAPPDDSQGEEGISSLEMTEAISSEWKDTVHAFALPGYGERAGCNSCHDGRGFSDQITEPDLEGGNPPHITGIDCQACHTGRGAELMASGAVEVPFAAEAIDGGTGAVCISCHNGRINPEELYAQFESGEAHLSYPHYGAQSALLFGNGGMELPDADYESSPHGSINDSCVACHMPETEDGYLKHIFVMDDAYVEQNCAACHGGITSYNLNGVQDEIKEMLEKVEAAILEATGAAEIGSSHGAFVFNDANGDPVEDISLEVYVAAYNWKLVETEGSYGIHNPRYAKSLLRQSYKALTGEDL